MKGCDDEDELKGGYRVEGVMYVWVWVIGPPNSTCSGNLI